LGYDVAVTSVWGTPNMIESGLNLELLTASKYGHAIHIWDLRRCRVIQSLDLGAEHQMALELVLRKISRLRYGLGAAITESGA
jgi:selenium-binding protein 1